MLEVSQDKECKKAKKNVTGGNDSEINRPEDES